MYVEEAVRTTTVTDCVWADSSSPLRAIINSHYPFSEISVAKQHETRLD